MFSKTKVFIFLLLGVLASCSPREQSLQAAPKETQNQNSNSDLSLDVSLLDEKILLGKFNPAQTKGFVEVPASMALQKNQYLHKETVEALEKLNVAAQKDSLQIYVVSAVRTYPQQEYIWQAKFNGERKSGGSFIDTQKAAQEKVDVILNYSSMPGTSRHHWGSDFDIFFAPQGVRLDNEVFEKGQGAKFYRWLATNAPKFGFCQPYKDAPHKRRVGYSKGYLEEKWHWSFMPISKPLTLYAEKNIEKLKPQNFLGAAEGEKIYHEYILNISAECLR